MSAVAPNAMQLDMACQSLAPGSHARQARIKYLKLYKLDIKLYQLRGVRSIMAQSR